MDRASPRRREPLSAGGAYAAEALQPLRLLAFVDLDPTFSPGGPEGSGLLVADLHGGEDQAFAVAVQPDGKIVVAGRGFFPGSQFVVPGSYAVVARFNVGGSRDDGGPLDLTPGDSFGNAGGRKFVFIAAFEGGAQRESFARAEAVAVQGDGKIVFGGDVVISDVAGGGVAAAGGARRGRGGRVVGEYSIPQPRVAVPGRARLPPSREPR